MAQEDLIVGERPSLAFEVKWTDARPSGTAADATLGRMCVHVAGQLVWGDGEATGSVGFEWPWVELLEHLAASWKYLEWEELDPLGLGGNPDTVRARAADRWAEMSAIDVEREDESLRGFETSHDLAAGLRGAWPPPIWVLRAGELAKVASGAARASVEWRVVCETLEMLGDGIAARVEGLDDERARAALRAWKGRRRVPDEEFLTIATGLSGERVHDLAGRGGLKAAFGLTPERRPNELLVAARMLGTQTAAPLARAVLKCVRSAAAHRAAGLDKLAEAAKDVELTGVPHAQGRALAIWLRRRMNLGDDARCKVEDFLQQLGVVVDDLEIDSKLIDAVCAWGPEHGPVIFVNANGPHSAGFRGYRATLAHELCHLLIDRGGALPVGEIKGGNVPREIEARANAFAAELLVPASAAGRLMATTKGTPAQALERVCNRYGASQAIVAWQTLNSDTHLPRAVKAHAERVAARAGGFGSWTAR